MEEENYKQIDNGLFVTDYKKLVSISWDILLHKENKIKQ
jgi:hypothetical protein